MNSWAYHNMSGSAQMTADDLTFLLLCFLVVALLCWLVETLRGED